VNDNLWKTIRPLGRIYSILFTKSGHIWAEIRALLPSETCNGTRGFGFGKIADRLLSHISMPWDADNGHFWAPSGALTESHASEICIRVSHRAPIHLKGRSRLVQRKFDNPQTRNNIFFRSIDNLRLDGALPLFGNAISIRISR